MSKIDYYSMTLDQLKESARVYDLKTLPDKAGLASMLNIHQKRIDAGIGIDKEQHRIELNDYTLPQLKEMLTYYHMKTSGSKKDLVRMLLELPIPKITVSGKIPVSPTHINIQITKAKEDVTRLKKSILARVKNIQDIIDKSNPSINNNNNIYKNDIKISPVLIQKEETHKEMPVTNRFDNQRRGLIRLIEKVAIDPSKYQSDLPIITQVVNDLEKLATTSSDRKSIKRFRLILEKLMEETNPFPAHSYVPSQPLDVTKASGMLDILHPPVARWNREKTEREEIERTRHAPSPSLKVNIYLRKYPEQRKLRQEYANLFVDIYTSLLAIPTMFYDYDKHDELVKMIYPGFKKYGDYQYALQKLYMDTEKLEDLKGKISSQESSDAHKSGNMFTFDIPYKNFNERRPDGYWSKLIPYYDDELDGFKKMMYMPDDRELDVFYDQLRSQIESTMSSIIDHFNNENNTNMSTTERDIVYILENKPSRVPIVRFKKPTKIPDTPPKNQSTNPLFSAFFGTSSQK